MTGPSSSGRDVFAGCGGCKGAEDILQATPRHSAICGQEQRKQVVTWILGGQLTTSLWLEYQGERASGVPAKTNPRWLEVSRLDREAEEARRKG